MNLKPIYNRLVVKRDDRLTKTESGILLALKETNDRNELKPEGTVLAIGHDVHDVAVGNRVIFRKMSGTEVKVDGQDLLVMTEDDVIAIIA
jgi:chaperonin GroES